MTVEFDEAVSSSSRPVARPSFFTRMVLKTGVVKTAAGAQLVLIVITIILVLIALLQVKEATVQAPYPTPEQSAL